MVYKPNLKWKSLIIFLYFGYTIYRKPIIIKIWWFFARYFFSPHFWLLENSKITWFLNFANKKKGLRMLLLLKFHSIALSLSLSCCCSHALAPFLFFFCSSWWKKREKKNDNGKDPALFSSTFATLLLLLCFSNSLLSFSVVVVFLLLFWSWLLDSKEVSGVCFDLDFWTRNWFDFPELFCSTNIRDFCSCSCSRFFPPHSVTFLFSSSSSSFCCCFDPDFWTRKSFDFRKFSFAVLLFVFTRFWKFLQFPVWSDAKLVWFSFRICVFFFFFFFSLCLSVSLSLGCVLS